MLQIHKFGGASISTPQRAKALLPIVQSIHGESVLVISAIGKTTNALEAIVDAAFSGEKATAHQLAKDLEQHHLDYAKMLLGEKFFQQTASGLNVLFTELQWAIDDADLERFDYSYDQIVCMGELMSTQILAAFFKENGVNAEWMDIRDMLRTDETWRDAKVDWNYTTQKVLRKMKPALTAQKIIVTQGFIGATADNASVTLGREGSDYTAALLAAMLSAKSVTIWKDVKGLLSADPKEFPEAVPIEKISFHEVIEMAFYGAQVIHPKTIKPLQNAGIPLFVKCFLEPDFSGTLIHHEAEPIQYPPLLILKRNQVLLQVTTRDFSFITEHNLKHLYTTFHDLRIRINLIQNAAISFVACIDNREDKIESLIAALKDDYKVLRNENLTLLTIRHYDAETFGNLTGNCEILLEQKTRQTVQVVMKESTC